MPIAGGDVGKIALEHVLSSKTLVAAPQSKEVGRGGNILEQE